jgi:cytochrome c5
MNLSKKVVVGTLMVASSLLALSQPVLAEDEMEIIDRIRPVGKVKISADRDVALVESLNKKVAEEPVETAAVVEVKEAVIEVVDQAAEATKEVVEQAAVAADSAIAAVNETTEAVVDKAAESAEKVELVAAEVVEKAEQVAAEAVAAISAQPVVASNELGLQVFNKTCFACHGTGIPGFPKVGDKAVWAPRIAQGKAVLVDHVINGFNAMPARGGNPDLTDAEVEAAVDYLIAEGS